MPLHEIEFRLVGDVVYRRAFEMLEREADDMRTPFGQIGERILAAVGRNFDTEGVANLGRKWAPLDDDYARWKAVHWPGKPILQASGDTKKGLTSRRALHVGRKRLVYEPEGRAGELGAIHHDGNANLPARPMVVFSLVERRAWDRVFAEWLNDLRHPVLR